MRPVRPKLYTRVWAPGKPGHGQLAPCWLSARGDPQPDAKYKGKRLPGRGYWLRFGRRGSPVSLGADWAAAITAYHSGAAPAPAVTVPVLPPTASLAEQIEAWLRSKEKPGHASNALRPASMVKYRQEMGDFLLYARQNDLLRAQDVTRDHLLAYGAVRKGTPVTQRNTMMVVAQMIQHATGKRLLRRGDVPRKPDPEPQEYSAAELDALLTRAEHRDLWLLFARTGLRDSEVAHLEWRDVDFAAHEIVVRDHPHRQQQVKDRERRHVPLADDLAAMLRPLRGEPGDLVFPSLHGGVERHYLRMLKRDAERIGLDPADCWLHRFRSTFASRLLSAGTDATQVMEWLGHSDFSTLRHYIARRNAGSPQARAQVAKAFQVGGTV